MNKALSSFKSSLKIVSINSSFRKNGNTKCIVKHVEEILSKLAPANNVIISYEHIALGDMNIQFCRGCRICFDKGEEYCPHKDKVLEIKQKIEDADGIILSSPVYVEDVSGLMKNWIDRMAFNCHRPAFAGKIAGIITTSGTGASKHSLKTMSTALSTWGVKVVCKANFKSGALISDEEVSRSFDKKLNDFGARLFKEIQQQPLNPSFYSLLAFKIQQNYWKNKTDSVNTVDYIYWKNNGWLDPSAKYYITYKCSYIKVMAARWLGGLLSILLFN